MRKGKGTTRRGAALVALALGTLAISGSGASAAAAGLPDILNGQANSQALDLKIELPAVAELQAALKKAGIDTSVADLSGLGDLGKVTLHQKISLNQGQVLRAAAADVTDVASGWSAVGQGDLLTNAVESRCTGPSCSENRSTAAQRVDLDVAGMNLGHLILNGADSATTSLVDTRNNARLAELLVNLRPLIGEGGSLEAVGSALAGLTDIFNAEVRPVVNGVIDDAKAALDETLPSNIKKDIIDRVIKIDHLKPLPDLSAVDLVSLSILGSKANVFPQARNGVDGLLAESSAKIADVSLLGGWSTIGGIDLSTTAYANGVAGDSIAKANSTVVGADLGGALGIDVDSMDLKLLTDPEYLFGVINKDAEVADPATLKPVLAEVAAATRLLAQIAGIDVTLFDTTERVSRNGMFAEAIAGSLAVTFEPRIPKVSALQSAVNAAAAVPVLGDDDFVSSGIRVSLTFPNSSASVQLGEVLGAKCVSGSPLCPPPTTGVATPLLAGLMLIGGAITIRRFALR